MAKKIYRCSEFQWERGSRENKYRRSVKEGEKEEQSCQKDLDYSLTSG